MEIQSFRGVGYECNSYLIKDDEWILIDVGTDRNAGRLAEAMSKEGGLEKVKKIMLTHTHFDHAGGAARMRELTGAEIFVHPYEGNRISSGDYSVISALFDVEAEGFDWKPVEEGDTVKSGSSKFKILHLPGHSEGSVALWEEESHSLIVGDTVFADGGIGRFDLPTGDMKSLQSSIQRISKLNVKNLYPGHGRSVLENGAMHIAMSLELIGGCT